MNKQDVIYICEIYIYTYIYSNVHTKVFDKNYGLVQCAEVSSDDENDIVDFEIKLPPNILKF